MAASRRRASAAQPSDDPISEEALERTASAMDALADRALQSTEHDADNDLNAPIQSRAGAIKDCATQIRNTILHCTLVTTLVTHIEKQDPVGQRPTQRTSRKRPRTPKSASGHNDGKSADDDPGSDGNDSNQGGGPSFNSLSQ